MAITVDELAVVVDSSLNICLTDEEAGIYSLSIIGAERRVGSGPELREVEGVGLTPDEARMDYAAKVAGQVLVMGGNPRGMEVRVPTTIIWGETGATGP